MLKQVRGALKSIVAWFVILLLVLAFAMWGVPELRTFTQRDPLQIGKKGVSAQLIVDEFNRQVNKQRGEDGKAITREEALKEGVDDDVVQRLATFSLLDQEAERLGLSLPTSEVVKFLKTDEQFKNPTSGEFDEQTLQSILQQNQLSEARLKEMLHSDIVRRMLIDSVIPGPAAPKAILRTLILHEVEQRQAAYIVVSEDMAGSASAPTQKQLTDYYEAHKANFETPEYRVFTAVMMKAEDFRAGVSVDEADVVKAYEAVKARLYVTPEKRTFYQVTFDDEASARAAVAAVKQGRPFENVAKDRGLSLAAVTFTDTPRSDILDPNVAAATFAATLQPGGVAEPVKGSFGWTVVQLVAVTAGSTRPLEEVRGEIVAELAKNDGRKAMLDAIEKFETARDGGGGLVAAAQAAGLTPQKYGPVDAMSFAPGGAIVADIPGIVLQEAFKLEEGEESEARELPDNGGYFFVQAEQVNPPAARPFKDVTAEVETKWRAEDTKKRIAAVSKKLKDEVAKGKTLEEAASALGRAPIMITVPRRGQSDVMSADFVKALYAANKGAVVSAPVAIGAGEVVAQVRDITFAHERVTPADEASFAQYLDFQMGQEFTDAYLESLRKDYGVRINQPAIDQLFSEQQ
jgi:peptidyl-prolyl cis-trans isomerase D